MRAVLDTNVLISSVISTGTPHKVVVAGFNGEYQIVVSVATLMEFRETLLKYPDRFQMEKEDIQKEVETVRYFAEFVEPNEEITAVVDDPDDDKFLEAAIAGNVDYLVSGDKHLLTLDSFREIEIVTPRAFYPRQAQCPFLKERAKRVSREGIRAVSSLDQLPTPTGPQACVIGRLMLQHSIYKVNGSARN